MLLLIDLVPFPWTTGLCFPPHCKESCYFLAFFKDARMNALNNGWGSMGRDLNFRMKLASQVPGMVCQLHDSTSSWSGDVRK